jgi:hypothetical protein
MLVTGSDGEHLHPGNVAVGCCHRVALCSVEEACHLVGVGARVVPETECLVFNVDGLDLGGGAIRRYGRFLF